jgi:RNA polymerase sigma factor (sigma-70 family)
MDCFSKLEMRMQMSVKLEDLNPTRRSLLERLKNWEDQESWNLFFNTYWRLVYSIAIRAGLSATEAGDVVQDTMITVARKMPEFNYDPAIGKFRSWLIKTTTFRIGDQFRKRQKALQQPAATATEGRTATIERVPDSASVNLDKICEEEWENNLFYLAVEKLKTQISAKHFNMFDLNVLKNWPARKVADTLKVNIALVHLTKHRALKLIKKEIAALRAKHI